MNDPIGYISSDFAVSYSSFNINGSWSFQHHFLLNVAVYLSFLTNQQDRNNTDAYLDNFIISSGITYRLPISHHFFFEPSLDLYLRNQSVHVSWVKDSGVVIEYSFRQNYLQIGATFGFEYFISQSFSVNSSVFNLAFGRALDHSYATVPRYNETSRFDIYKWFTRNKISFWKSEEKLKQLTAFRSSAFMRQTLL